MKYNGESEWDFHTDGIHQPLDLDLILPHYRARNQPIDHRMSMFVANDHQPIKLKVVRSNLTCQILARPNRCFLGTVPKLPSL